MYHEATQSKRWMEANGLPKTFKIDHQEVVSLTEVLKTRDEACGDVTS